MLVSTLRNSIRPDDLEIPPRPKVKAQEIGEYKKKDGSKSAMFKVLLVLRQQQESAKKCNTVDDIARLEIFGCVQRLKHNCISRWKQVADVDLRIRKAPRKCSDSYGYAYDNDSKSVKIAGFQEGFKYQIVVRAVDAHGNRSLFSQPVAITPFQQGTDNYTKETT